MTKTGKVRYYFAREPNDGAPDRIPEGYRISESVNGVVSLIKDRPQLILAQEVASVEAALDRHPKGRDYRVAVKKNQIVIYEPPGPDVETLSAMFMKLSPFPSDVVKKHLQEELDKTARFSPIMRFTLVDPEERRFTAERWCFSGSIDDWIDAGEYGEIERLAQLRHNLFFRSKEFRTQYVG